MTGRLTGYVCSCCGFIIMELTPVSPCCPVCAIYGCTAGRMVEAADVAEVKLLAVKLYLREQPEPVEMAAHLPATD